MRESTESLRAEKGRLSEVLWSVREICVVREGYEHKWQVRKMRICGSVCLKKFRKKTLYLSETHYVL